MSTLLDLITLTPKGNIGGIDVQATLEEVFTDSIQITEHPIELGASVGDHAYVRPIELVMRCGFSNSTASNVASVAASLFGSSMSGASTVDDLYSQLLALQQSLVPFSVVTSRRKFDNMLITSLATTTDNRSSNALFVTVNMRQIFIVGTQVTTMATAATQANPASTQAMAGRGFVNPAVVVPSPGGAVNPANF